MGRLLRFSLILSVLLALLAAMWAGLIRMGWAFSPIEPLLPMLHGPLMVCGFLGVLLALERSVALRTAASDSVGRNGVSGGWYYLSPVLTALGSLILLAGIAGWPGRLLITLGSLGLVMIFAIIIRRQPALYTIIMGLGAASWLIGNVQWLSGQPIYAVVLWWLGFPLLTIAGERLELSRLLRISRTSQAVFLSALGLFLVGAAWAGTNLYSGVRVAALGEIILALWLARHDIARRTVHKAGLTRYIAVCLLLGYFWLGVSGLVGIWLGGVPAGPYYDALLHSIFVGFVISMIFGHAPIILPALLKMTIVYRPSFYMHLALLHLSLAVRIAGDLMGSPAIRQWGGMFNVIALLLFLANTARVVWASREAQGSLAKPASTPTTPEITAL